jgi:hypothetical protein
MLSIQAETSVGLLTLSACCMRIRSSRPRRFDCEVLSERQERESEGEGDGRKRGEMRGGTGREVGCDKPFSYIDGEQWGVQWVVYKEAAA